MIRYARSLKCVATLVFLSVFFIRPQTVTAEVSKNGAMCDLSRAVVVAPGALTNPEKKAAAMLVEEVERRTGVRWRVGASAEPGETSIKIGRESNLGEIAGVPAAVAGADGYRIRVDASGRSILIVGNDARGVLFGAGRLLRELRMSRGHVLIPSDFTIATAPKTSLRGHQLGYRPKTNSYDAWDLDQWERYIRDLVVFGTNAVELIPPRSDDDADSPHFPRPHREPGLGGNGRGCHVGEVWLIRKID